MATDDRGLQGFRERKDEVARAIVELRDVATVVGADSLRKHVEDELIRKLDEDRFHLVVVGEFNHGKSSFVNALLGEAVLPVGVTPTTAAIHHIRHAAAPEATVVTTSGAREALAFDEVKRFSVGGGDERREDVDYLEIGYPSPLLAERILLVDTPGVNDLSQQRADITYSYIPRADAVLFLLDAGQILKESERIFLEDKLLKASRDKIVFVITKWDLLSETERVEALAYAKSQLAKLVKAPVVFPVSALLAQSNERAASGFPELVVHLTKFLAEERGRILLDNALSEGERVGALLARGVQARVRAHAMKSDEIARRVSALEADLAGQAQTVEQRRSRVREEITGIKVGVRKDLERCVEDVCRQLPGVIDAAKADELKKFLPGFLEQTIRTWADAETREIAAQLEALAEKTIALVKDDADDAHKRVGEALGADTRRLDVSVDTFHYDVGVSALLAVGVGTLFVNLMLGGVLIAAAPVVAYMLRGRIEGETKKRAKEVAPDAVRAAAAKIGPKLDELIDAFATRLDAWVVSASEEVHREVLDVLRATERERAEGRVEGEAGAKAVEALGKRLEAARANVERIRAALWMPEGAERVRVAAPAEASPAA